jgi:aquaporin Z
MLSFTNHTMNNPSEKKLQLEKAEFTDKKREWRRLFAEAWGTFLLVLVATGAAVVARQSGQISKEMSVIAPGLMVMVIIYMMGSVSGAHINPAVTIAFALRQHFPWRRVPLYIVVQFAGAILASLFVSSVIGTEEKIGATIPENISEAKTFIIETLLTTGLINTILGTSSGPRNVGHNAALAIGAYIAIAGIWAAPLTGASMNMARSAAPDIVRGDFETTWIYIAASLCGACIAVGFEWILKGKPSEHATKEAQGLE